MKTHVVQCPDCRGQDPMRAIECIRCMGLGRVPAHDGIAEWVGWCPALHEFMKVEEQ